MYDFRLNLRAFGWLRHLATDTRISQIAQIKNAHVSVTNESAIRENLRHLRICGKASRRAVLSGRNFIEDGTAIGFFGDGV